MTSKSGLLYTYAVKQFMPHNQTVMQFLLLILGLSIVVQPLFADSRFGSLTHIKDPEMQGLPGQWVRPHPGPFIWGRIETSPGKYKWKQSDKVVETSQQRNQTILATVWPYADWEQESCGRKKVRSPFGRRFPSHLSKPCSMEAYLEFVKKLLDRYDGNGQNDMPGLLKPIRYWEIMNEPEFDMFFSGSQNDFVDIFIASSRLIRSLQSDAVIVLAGAAGMFGESERYWDHILPALNTHFDIATIHHIPGPDGRCERDLWVGKFKNLLDKHKIQKPIWVTEAQPTARCGVVRSYISAFSKGADIIFDVGVRAPGNRMSANDRANLNTLMAEYDNFESVTIQKSGAIVFKFDDGSTKEWIGIIPSKNKSAQGMTDSGRED